MLPYIDVPFQYVAGALGASPDEIKLIFSFLLSYPLAGVLKRIPDAKPALKNFFIISVSIFYLVGLFDLWAGLRTLAISATGTYCIAKYLHGPFMPWVGFVFAMGHLSINQLARQFANDPGRVDVTGAQMVMVMKLTAFCWNVADGRQQEKELSPLQQERALRELPSILDFAGYILFFPSLFAGPSFDYVDYRRWIETTMFDVPANVDASKKPPTRKKRKIPRSGTPAAWKAAAGFLWIFAFIQLSGRYPSELLTGDRYQSYGFLRRVWILHMFAITARTKYYGVWALTEGACILSGMGYQGIDSVTGKVSWSRLQNVSPWGVESAQNTRDFLGSWNMNTNNWLRNYVYLRVTPKGKKPGFRASMATFVTSAVWHGFFPGYYLAFVTASFIQTVAKNCRRYFRPFFLDPTSGQPKRAKVYYDAASYLSTQLVFSFTVSPFILLTLPSTLLVWSRVYFYGVIVTGLATGFFASPAKQYLIKKLNARTAGAHTPLNKDQSRENRSNKEPLLGLPAEPGKDLDEIIAEVRAELDKQKANGNSRPIPAVSKKLS